MAALAVPSTALAATGGAGPADAVSPTSAKSTGGVTYGSRFSSPSQPTVPGTVARLRKGVAYAPASAPIEVQRAIWAGNRLQDKPYRYGGGHRSFNDTAYDCSGTVSYVLNAARLLRRPFASTDFMGWGASGAGRWITVYTNAGHAYVILAGLRLDTSTGGERSTSGNGPRWRHTARASSAFMARHPAGF